MLSPYSSSAARGLVCCHPTPECTVTISIERLSHRLREPLLKRRGYLIDFLVLIEFVVPEGDRAFSGGDR